MIRIFHLTLNNLMKENESRNKRKQQYIKFQHNDIVAILLENNYDVLQF